MHDTKYRKLHEGPFTIYITQCPKTYKRAYEELKSGYRPGQRTAVLCHFFEHTSKRVSQVTISRQNDRFIHRFPHKIPSTFVGITATWLIECCNHEITNLLCGSVTRCCFSLSWLKSNVQHDLVKARNGIPARAHAENDAYWESSLQAADSFPSTAVQSLCRNCHCRGHDWIFWEEWMLQLTLVVVKANEDKHASHIAIYLIEVLVLEA